MIACEINIKNGIPVVKTYPKLMRDITVYTNLDIEQSLDLYGLVLTEEFQELGIKNPTLENILTFNEQDHISTSTPLTKLDKRNLLNLSLQTSNVDDIKQSFIESFTVNGHFGIDIAQINKIGLFSESDIMEMGDAENVIKLKNLWHKLNNSDEVITGIQNPIVFKNSLFEAVNPDVFLQNLHDNYAGIDSKEGILDKANEIGDEIILENPEIIPYVISVVKNKQSLVQYETDEYNGEITKKVKNNTRTTLEQTFDVTQDMTGFLQQLEFVREIPVEMYVTNSAEVLRYINNLEIQASNMGLDLLNLSDVLMDKNHNEILEFFDTLYNFLYDIQSANADSIVESMDMYSNTYDSFFNTESLPKNTTVDKINKQGVFLHLETNKSEEELFSKYGLLKVSDNIYQKITDDNTLEDLYSMLIENSSLLPKNTFTVANTELNRDIINEDVDIYISSLAKPYLNENSIPETVKKMVVYKIITGIETESNEIIPTGLGNFDVNEFLTNFNIQMLKNPKLKELFYFSNRGLEADTFLGDYTVEDLKIELSEQDFKDLVSYSKISGNTSLEPLTKLDTEIADVNQRDYYANNLTKLEPYDGEYYNENGYLITNSDQDFIRVKNQLFESVAPNVFAKIEVSPRYASSGLSKPYYDNSVTPVIKAKEGGSIKISKVKEINDNEIEFC